MAQKTQLAFKEGETACFRFLPGISDPELEEFDGEEVTVHKVDDTDELTPYGIQIDGCHDLNDPNDFSSVSEQELE